LAGWLVGGAWALLSWFVMVWLQSRGEVEPEPKSAHGEVRGWAGAEDAVILDARDPLGAAPLASSQERGTWARALRLAVELTGAPFDGLGIGRETGVGRSEGVDGVPVMVHGIEGVKDLQQEYHRENDEPGGKCGPGYAPMKAVKPGPVIPGPVKPAPVQPAPVQPAPVHGVLRHTGKHT